MKAYQRLVLLLLTAIAARGQANLDDVVKRTLQEFDVPGMAVGVIQDGNVRLLKGYGVRELGESAPVTGKTLFGIASNTKAFTAAALAILVDEKKIDWDQRVVDILPWFQMSDPYVSREMRIRDLLVHRSGLGLGAGDLMLFPEATLTAREIMQRLRYVPLATSFRSTYAYDNVLYIVAGAVIEQASGTTWERFIRERIFQPLGMTRSRTSVNDVPPGEDLAWPHAPAEGKLRVLQHTKLDPAAPAGAIQSSVEDMLKWAATQLNEGQYAGGRLFSAKQSQEMWTPHIFVPIAADPPKELAVAMPIFQAYALGWVIRDYRGQRIVYHGGALGGMVTRVTLVPGKKLAIIVFTNQEVGSAFQAVTMSILDHYLDAPASDCVSAYGAVRKRDLDKAHQAEAEAGSKRNAASKPSLQLAQYAGRYRDPWYADVWVEEKEGKLWMRFTHSALTGLMEHFQYDTFIAKWTDRSYDADAYVTFSLNPDGSTREVKMKAVSSLTDFSFDFHDLVLTPVAKDAPAY
jgi:CubicO group peptidase (beta-lactamase class C family)